MMVPWWWLLVAYAVGGIFTVFSVVVFLLARDALRRARLMDDYERAMRPQRQQVDFTKQQPPRAVK